MNEQLPATQSDPQPASGAVIEAFSFGDAESVLDRRELSQFYEIYHNSRWYEPPLPMARLAQVFNMSPHHRSAVALKVNLLVAHQQPSRWLSSGDFERFVIDFIQMGNGYLERVPNLAGNLLRAAFAPARHVRRGVDPNQFWFVEHGIGQEHEFAPGGVFQLQQPDVAQEIYGLPEWLSALQSGLLNENATLFRRRYYLNGAHAGSVFYLSEALADKETGDKMAEAMKASKGVGNFKNMFLHIPNGKKDGFQVMPIADAMAKDEFANVKNISRDDMLAAHRVPPQLIGIIPQNAAGFGKPAEAKDAFIMMEIVPLARRMRQMNEWFGVEILRFAPYVTADGDAIDLNAA